MLYFYFILDFRCSTLSFFIIELLTFYHENGSRTVYTCHGFSYETVLACFSLTTKDTKDNAQFWFITSVKITIEGIKDREENKQMIIPPYPALVA